MDTPSYSTLILERREPLAFIRLNRPDRLNTINRQMKDDLLAVLDLLRADVAVRALVIAGAGDKAFCAGADVNEFKDKGPVDRWRYDWDFPRRIFEEIERYVKPVIAMIHGYCVGGGAEIALACDLRVASEDADMGLTEIRFGMIPGAGGTQRLARLVGEGRAMKLASPGIVSPVEWRRRSASSRRWCPVPNWRSRRSPWPSESSDTARSPCRSPSTRCGTRPACRSKPGSSMRSRLARCASRQRTRKRRSAPSSSAASLTIRAVE